MSKLNDIASSGKIQEIIKSEEIIKNETGQLEKEPWGTGLSSLLTLPPSVPFVQYNERRSGQDRRSSDRRLAAREFKVSEDS